jgi:LPXTG-motif cell wall-anchored protein
MPQARRTGERMAWLLVAGITGALIAAFLVLRTFM